MLHNFLFDICGLTGNFTLQKREQQCVDYIRRTVGRDKIVLMLVSGGVDSAVCAALLHKALSQGSDTARVQAIHIDNGFLRKDESDQVVNSLQELGLNLRVRSRSMCHLYGISCFGVSFRVTRRVSDDATTVQ